MDVLTLQRWDRVRDGFSSHGAGVFLAGASATWWSAAAIYFGTLLPGVVASRADPRPSGAARVRLLGRPVDRGGSLRRATGRGTRLVYPHCEAAPTGPPRGRPRAPASCGSPGLTLSADAADAGTAGETTHGWPRAVKPGQAYTVRCERAAQGAVCRSSTGRLSRGSQVRSSSLWILLHFPGRQTFWQLLGRKEEVAPAPTLPTP